MSGIIRDVLIPGFNGGIVASKHVIAGIHVVKTSTQRNAIPALSRALDGTETTIVFVMDDNLWYQLITNPAGDATVDADWQQMVFSTTDPGLSDLLSAVSAQAAIGIDIVSNALSNEASVRSVKDDSLSNRISAIASVVGSVTSNELSIVSANAQVAIDIVSATLQNEQSVRASEIDRLSNEISNQASVQGSINLSTHNAISDLYSIANRLSATGGGGGSVTSTELSQANSVVSARAQSAINTQSAKIAAICAISVASLGTSVQGLQSVVNTLSNNISLEVSNRKSADDVLSQGISVLSQQASVASQGLSNEISNRVSAGNALSNTISQNASIVSQGLSLQSQFKSVASQALSLHSQQLSQHSQNLSAMSNTVSNNASAVSQGLSLLSQGISVVSNALSNETSNRTSADNVLSNRISANSGVASVTSTKLSAKFDGIKLKPAAMHAIWHGSNPIPAYTYNNGTSGIGATITGNSVGILSVGANVDVLSGDLVLFAYENLGPGVSTPNCGLYRCTQQGTTSTVFVLTRHETMDEPADFNYPICPAALGIIYGGGPYEAMFMGIPAGFPFVIGTTGMGFEVVGTTDDLIASRVLDEMSNRTSVDNIFSQQISVLSQSHSVLSNRVSANSGTGGGSGSVTSTELSNGLSIVSAQAKSAIDVVSQNLSARIIVSVSAPASPFSGQLWVDTSQTISTVSNALSNEISNRTSADNALSNTISNNASIVSQGLSLLSQGVSVVSNALSNEISNRTSADNALSNTISNNASIVSQGLSLLSQQISVLSQQASVLSQGVSVVSNALSNEISNRTSAGNALSNTISNNASIVSQGLSVASQNLSLISNKVSNEISNRTSADNALSNTISNNASIVSQGLSLMSQGISVISNALSNEISNRISADNALSNSISNVLSAHNALSNVVSADSTLIGGGGGSVTSTKVSQALSVVSAQAASAISQLNSVVSQGFSLLSNAISIVSNAVSKELSNRVSADNQLSNSISIVSNSLSSQNLAIGVLQSFRSYQLALRNMQNLNGTSVRGCQPVYMFTSANTFKLADADAGGNAGYVVGLTKGQIVSVAISGTVSVVTNGYITGTTAEWSAVVGNATGLTPGTIYYLANTAGTLTTIAQGAKVGVALDVVTMELNIEFPSTGAGGSVTSDKLSAASAQAASAISQLNSVVSQGLSLLSQGISVVSQALSNEISNRTSADNAVSAQAASANSQLNSIISQGLSLHSQQISVLSQGVSVVSNALSNEISNRISADNVVSAQAASANSQLNSIISQGFSLFSQQISVLSQGLSTLSASFANQLSILSQQASVISQQLSTLSQSASVLSQAISVMSQQVSANGAPTVAFRSNVVSVVSGTGLVDIVSMSVSCGVGAYIVNGGLMFECGTSGGFAFGVSTPALAAGGSYVHMIMTSAILQGGTGTGVAIGNVALSAVAAGQTVVVSASVATINSMRFVKIEAFLNVSAGGSFQVMAKTSVAGASMSVRSGWLRAYKVGS